jgi:hypothetical protein
MKARWPAADPLERERLLGPGAPRLLFPFACFACRVAFKRPLPTDESRRRKCPQCGGSAVLLSRKFKAPPKGNIAQWEKVRFLVEHGFLFQSVGAPYPRTLRAAREFVKRHGAGKTTRGRGEQRTPSNNRMQRTAPGNSERRR